MEPVFEGIMKHLQLCEDRQLLEAYASSKSDEAFRQIVERHGRWVFAAAYRQLQDRQLAEDAAQVVFILLAKRANAMHLGPKLSGWLFNTLQYTVKNMQRMRARRAKYEHQAAAERPTAVAAAPVALHETALQLDTAVARLSASDRTAILLRFYQDHSFAEIAASMGVSEEAARKRVGRAVIALRRFLGADARNADDAGITAASALGLALAPAHLTQHLTTVALSAKAGAALPLTLTAATKGTAWLMTLTKIQTAALLTSASLLVAVPATVATVHYMTGPEVPQGAQVAQPAPLETNDQLAEFNRIYVLKAGEILVRISPPFADSRSAGYALVNQAQLHRAQLALQRAQLDAGNMPAGMAAPVLPPPAARGQAMTTVTDQDGNSWAIAGGSGGGVPTGAMVPMTSGGTQSGGAVRVVRGNGVGLVAAPGGGMGGIGSGGGGGGGGGSVNVNGEAMGTVGGNRQTTPLAMVIRWIENSPSEIEYTQWGNAVQGLSISKLTQVLFKLEPDALEGDNNLLGRTIPGDFIYRDGAREDPMRQALSGVLSDFLGTPVTAEFREVDRKVYVLRGQWNYQPVNAAGGATNDRLPNIHLYSTDMGRITGSSSGSGAKDPQHSVLAAVIAKELKTPVILEVEGLPASLQVSEHNIPGTQPDPKAVLDHVAEQTGLTWTEETHRVRHLFIEPAK